MLNVRPGVARLLALVDGAPKFIDEWAPCVEKVGDVAGSAGEGAEGRKLDAPLMNIIRNIPGEVCHETLIDLRLHAFLVNAELKANPLDEFTPAAPCES